MMTADQTTAARNHLSFTAFQMLLTIDKFGPSGIYSGDIQDAMGPGLNQMTDDDFYEAIEELNVVGAVEEVDDYVYAVRQAWVENL